jgi:signal transduction histidine kinase
VLKFEKIRGEIVFAVKSMIEASTFYYEKIFSYLFTPSIKTRVLVWFGLTSFFILFIFSAAFYYFFNESVNLKIQNQLYDKALSIKESIHTGESLENILHDRRYLDYYIAIFKDEKIIAKNKNFDYEKLKNKLNPNEFFYTFHKHESINAIYILPINKPYKADIFIYKKGIDDKVENVIDTLLVLEPILLLVLIFLASRLIDKILVPVKNITKTANEITISDFSKSIKRPKDNDEIRALVDSFNEMIRRLKEGVEKIERFNNDVSHELKTPLTVIKGEVEITLDKLREPQEYIKSMKVIDEEAEQIKNIVDNLLLLSKYSKSNIQNSYEICNVESIFLKVLEKYNKALKEKKLSLHVSKLENIQTKANQVLLETIFSNLIDNAIKYTPKNKNIYISLYKDEKIHFIVKDEGIGIPKDKIPFVTDRFYRVDESRNKKIKGFGLGLSIVKNAVKLHNGNLIIDSLEGIGTTLHVEL